jgi:peptide/nickel transport system permease protein/oligopeptide transport system permease protein
VIIAIPAGLIAAVRPNTIISQIVMLLALLGQAMPGFWLGVMMILLFSVQLGLLPTGGRGTPLHLVMPAIVLGSWGAAKITRLTRAGMQEVMGEDFIRTARSKGLQERSVLFGHALRNALLPVLSALGLTVGVMLGGAIITETVFAWPGVGRLIVQSVLKRDFPVVQVATILLAVIFIASNLTVDILYTVVDPRIRYD